jgi:hypothetical protein
MFDLDVIDMMIIQYVKGWHLHTPLFVTATTLIFTTAVHHSKVVFLPTSVHRSKMHGLSMNLQTFYSISAQKIILLRAECPLQVATASNKLYIPE